MGPLTHIEVAIEEVHSVSCDLLQLFTDDEIPQGVGILALLMTLGRIMSPAILTQDQEVAFIQTMMEFSGMYFSEEGEAN